MTAGVQPHKISSAEIYAHFKTLDLSLERLLAYGTKKPPLLIYKPRKNGHGQAMKLDLNLHISFVPNSERIAESKGGLFLEIVDQAGDRGGFPAFAWGGKVGDGVDEKRSVRIKFGMPDITALLAGIRHIRNTGTVALPEGLVANQKAERRDYSKLVMVHKFNDAVSVISYQFTPTGGFLKVSKTRDWVKSISLTLAEEIAFESYLQAALQQFLNAGLR